MNLGTFLMILSVAICYVFVVVYRNVKGSVPDVKKLTSALLIIANVLTILCVTTEIEYKYERNIRAIQKTNIAQMQENVNYMGGANYGSRYTIPVNNNANSYAQTKDIENAKTTAVSIFWAFYAILLIAIGFAKRIRHIRLFGLIFFFITAARVFIQILGSADEIGRIVSTIAFGLIALGASFLYVKFKDRIINE